jgi:hypothetical protein
MKKLIGYLLSILTVSCAITPLFVSAEFGDPKYIAGIDVPGTEDGKKGAALIDSIKNFINRALGMLATIALVICLYAGFLMVTSAGNDANYKKGFTILKQAGIGLVIIGLAWSIVSLIFWFIEIMA